MPAAPSHALLSLSDLIDELDTLPADDAKRIAEPDPTLRDRIAAARTDAMERLAAADRLDVFTAATQRLAATCIRREIPQAARAAAYSALVGLIASDLLPPATFRTLYDGWESALSGLHGSAAAPDDGEEVLLHIE